MYISKKINRTTFKISIRLINKLVLINASLDRFYGVTLNLTFMNISFSVHYISKKQEQAFASLVSSVRELEDETDEWF